MVDIRTYSLTIEHHEEDGGYLAYFPALPGCHTWGETYEEAIKNAEEALDLYIETLAAHGDPIPEEGTPAAPISLGLTIRRRTATPA